MGKPLTPQKRFERDEEKRLRREVVWLANLGRWDLSTPHAVTNAMGKTLRAWANQQISAETYKLLFAGLKTIRDGRVEEIHLARGGVADLPAPFVGLTVVYSEDRRPTGLKAVIKGNGAG